MPYPVNMSSDEVEQKSVPVLSLFMRTPGIYKAFGSQPPPSEFLFSSDMPEETDPTMWPKFCRRAAQNAEVMLCSVSVAQALYEEASLLENGEVKRVIGSWSKSAQETIGEYII